MVSAWVRRTSRNMAQLQYPWLFAVFLSVCGSMGASTWLCECIPTFHWQLSYGRGGELSPYVNKKTRSLVIWPLSKCTRNRRRS
ncbi:hypothetical protein BJ138DRAFT_1160081 [Hygrophoropsis aurantiaca]|uniref:Uncharacterized protein n=1 Tax=Hygrophoropsis aurantiaca TaxID=72124 RepID=A0ACB8A444_9AGAM|nr:hypothetical protein BJ138DRAFT_1160081 [Hygrophoropsis aurantiaca]